MNIKNRQGELVKQKKKHIGLKILYSFILGRITLKVLTRPTISKVGGLYLSSPLSKVWNKQFIKKNKINMEEYESKKYRSYNDLFTRKIKDEFRPIDMNPKSFISPCDSKLTVYPINNESVFTIKESKYTISELVDGKKIKDYKGGFALVFRLEPTDYHHYCYIDSGTKEENVFIKGVLHTVQPVSSKYKVFKRNSREYTILHTKNFKDIVQIEVGAMMVGKIINHHGKYKFKKGEEKGLFEFGGSTIVLLVKKNVIRIDSDIIENSLLGIETIVKYGEKIGIKKDNKN